ncbi:MULTISPECIES: helix-turn-helix domain-containing protein [Ensifer]|uniref:helix-turn-helix domain-containing protein n=1 Tax=Ensifer TaxID=106591 RepID=UPI00046CD4A9|nr:MULTISPECIES: helix-turn-helix domain-containing protein [Ensifer]MDP9629193.1 AraC-like DNA-binding protein [Ensifer adhaerens]KQU90563.1 AraC family transcriptional regulator [Ensifer sp. Root31]KQW67309.1 AraC family transcriptional regulator [Ensifer sp. Root127]KQY63166.1 AraC family transcriptional regulator [Ensifer sp. Root142]MBD9487923.1 helix-turn-helix domain-containing protein [Ensifer sp. ENS11]
MDEIEGGILSAIPAAALTLNLTRAAIRMEHSQTWRIDKSNPVDDLVICLEGRGHYLIDGEPRVMERGDAMLISGGQHFIGWNEGRETYIGVAQHFTLDIYGRHNLIEQMQLRPKLQLSRWPFLEPIARHYRQSAPPSSVSLGQHHLFMVLLIAFIEDAFLGWRDHATYQPEGADAIDLAVMKAATMISANPLETDIAMRAVDAAPYNYDYFLREFQKRVGRTPRKYQELKRMERAMHFLEGGLSVAAAAAEVGYADPYYFSRMFKRTLGLSPRDHLNKVHQSRHGDLMQLDEPEQEIRLATARTIEKR